MAESARFDDLLQALRLAWQCGCQASAAQFRDGLAAWTTTKGGEGRDLPRGLTVRPVRPGPNEADAALEIDWADLYRHRWLRPASLSLAFDCVLQPTRGGSWRLVIVHPSRKAWWGGVRRHQVEIRLGGADEPQGEVRFNDLTWRRFGRGPA
jgi:hypothetical protein